MILRPRDTDAAAWSKYSDVLDGMDGSARLAAALELSEAVRELRLAGIQARDPELDHHEAIRRLVEEDHGVRLPSAS